MTLEMIIIIVWAVVTTGVVIYALIKGKNPTGKGT